MYRIGDIGFDPDACEICVDGHWEHLQPQLRSVLLCLVIHQGEVVSKETLATEAWDGRLTSDESITRCISLLRKLFVDKDCHGFIETIPKVGYRFTGPVESDSIAHFLANTENDHQHFAPVAMKQNTNTRTLVLVLTGAAAVLVLSGLAIAADFFYLNP